MMDSVDRKEVIVICGIMFLLFGGLAVELVDVRFDSYVLTEDLPYQYYTEECECLKWDRNGWCINQTNFFNELEVCFGRENMSYTEFYNNMKNLEDEIFSMTRNVILLDTVNFKQPECVKSKCGPVRYVIE